MDWKNSARSKRAHSLQHKKAAQKPRPPNPSSSHTKPQSQNKEKARLSQNPPSQSLPSNWDRYEEEFDSGTEDADDPLKTSQNDAVEPKSKGADFDFLISEAQNEQRTQPKTAVDNYAFTEFDRWISSTISVRGESIFSWCSDDNFIVDDNTTSTHEASFLSLDLHALAMQLEKIDVSKRLFIEEDLLPIVQGLEGVEIYDASGPKDDVHPLTNEDIGSSTAMEDVPDSYGLMLSTTDGCDGSVDVTPSTDVENSSRNFPVHVPMPDPLKNQNHQREISTSVGGEAGGKSPAKFEATSAEAELDILLNTFGETKLLESLDMDEKFTIDLPEEVHDSHSFNLKDSSVPVIDQPLWSSTSGHSINVSCSKSSNPNSESPAALPQPERSNGTGSFSVSNPLEDFESWLDTI